DSYVKLLRKKLESADGQMIISTIRGVGYKLEIK
ncbi:MAG: winged helix-turn-helix domain-containing protein, partial [Selenomonadaceae bacterium]|nr:winged helix-turn-helix domain-containing protein [Selenomonadaceae bacterium]